MSRDGSGNYSRAVADYVADDIIEPDGATGVNTEMDDIADALTDSLTANGEKVWTGNQNAGGFRVTELNVPATARSTLTPEMLAGCTPGGSGNAYTATTGDTLTAYYTGMIVGFKANHSNSGASTLNVDAIGAKDIKKGGTTAVATGDIVSGRFYIFEYDGTNFQLLGGVYGTDITTAIAASSQPLDATLTAFAALSTADNSMLDFTGTDTMAVVSYATVVTNLAVAGLALANIFTAAQTINLNAAGAPSAISAATALQLVAADGGATGLELHAFATNPIIAMGRANGTNASKTVAAAGDNLGQHRAVGWDGSAFQIGSIQDTLALETFSGSTRASYHRFRTCLPGSTSLTELYRLGDRTSAIEVGKACSVPTSRTADWTMAATDESGATDYHTSGSTHTFTIPANASVALPVGFVRIIDNTGNSGAAGAVTVAITSDTLRRGDGVSGTGSRTVPVGGVACIRKVASTEWIITGTFT